MRFESRVLSRSSACVRGTRLGLFGVVIRELFIDDTKLFVEGSQVELLEAYFVDVLYLTMTLEPSASVLDCFP